MNVNAAASMQQTQLRKMDGSGSGSQVNASTNRMLNETLKMLPQETQSEIQALMQTLDPENKQDIKSQMAQIESSNMTVEDLTEAIMDIFKPSITPEESSFPASFSVYA